MNNLGYIRCAQRYLQMFGFAGLSKAAAATATRSVALCKSGCSGQPACRAVARSFLGPVDLLPGLHEARLRFLRRIASRVIVDAGANIGLASVWFANRFPQAKIIAIEPRAGQLRTAAPQCFALSEHPAAARGIVESQRRDRPAGSRARRLGLHYRDQPFRRGFACTHAAHGARHHGGRPDGGIHAGRNRPAEDRH